MENGTNNNGNGEQQSQGQDPKKMSYIQMAKMGYQELVNAIIRPPRADYKVRHEKTEPVTDRFCFLHECLTAHTTLFEFQ